MGSGARNLILRGAVARRRSRLLCKLESTVPVECRPNYLGDWLSSANSREEVLNSG